MSVLADNFQEIKHGFVAFFVKFWDGIRLKEMGVKGCNGEINLGFKVVIWFQAGACLRSGCGGI